MKTRRFHIFEYYVASYSELKKEAENLSEELSKWKENFKDLENESKKLFDEMTKELEKKDEIIDDLSAANQELKSYIDCLTKSERIAYKGKDISVVKKKSRTLKCFLSRARTALWFAQSFGLDITSINVTEASTGIVHSVSMSECSENVADDPTTSTSGNKYGFNALSQSDKEKVEEILFILDKFCVNDEFYHEVSMLDNSLPKSYLIKQRRDQLNKLCHISRTPGEVDGCQIDFQDSLKHHLESFI